MLLVDHLRSRSPGHAIADLMPELARIEEGPDRVCFFARVIDHQGYVLNHRGEHAAAEALYRQIPEDGPAFARVRRGNGLAYSLWKQGKVGEAAQEAELAARCAGDGGHVRLRAMSLSMLGRIDATRGDAIGRARAIATGIEDELLAWRFRERGLEDQ